MEVSSLGPFWTFIQIPKPPHILEKLDIKLCTEKPRTGLTQNYQREWFHQFKGEKKKGGEGRIKLLINRQTGKKHTLRTQAQRKDEI